MKEIVLANAITLILSSTGDNLERYDLVLKWINEKKKLWNFDRIRVGVMGVTSSGKSTLINAILGDDLLSVAVRPSSSQLVSCSHAKMRSAVIYFKNGEKKELGDTNDLKKSIAQYSDERYNQRNEKQVTQIDLSAPNFDLGEDVLLIDSPGLDATGYDAHEKLTLETLLPSVDVVIFVTTTKSEIDSKMKQIFNKIAEYNCPLMVVQNMLDAVRPSADGRKSAEVVASERLKRVKSALDHSNIKDKSNVRIAQISAVRAKEYRCKKVHSTEDERKYQSSRYKEFVRGVRELVENTRPFVEQQRITTIVEYIKEMIKSEDAVLQRKSSMQIKIDVSKGSLKQISSDLSAVLFRTENRINGVIKELNTLAEHAQNAINGSAIESLKQATRPLESTVVDCVRAFSAKFADVIRELNMPARDLWSYNGLPRIQEAEVKTTVVTHSREVKKKGLWNGIKRFFSFGYCGYETVNVPETVIDENATRESARRYIQRLQFEYGKTYENWHNNALETLKSVEREIDLRLSAIAAREKLDLDANIWQSTKDKLQSCIARYSVRYVARSNQFHAVVVTDNNREDTKTVRASRTMLYLFKAAEKYLRAVQISVLQRILRTKVRIGFPVMVVSKSSDDLSEFLFRFFSVEPQTFVAGKIYEVNKGITVVCASSKQHLDQIVWPKGDVNVFFLMNGQQMHTNDDTTLRKYVAEKLSNLAAFFMVVQDFEVLANGDGITECIRSILYEQDSTLSGKNGMTIISHQNPVYNMAMFLMQSTSSRIDIENIFYDALDKKCRFLVNAVVKKRINSILRSTKV